MIPRLSGHGCPIPKVDPTSQECRDQLSWQLVYRVERSRRVSTTKVPAQPKSQSSAWNGPSASPAQAGWPEPKPQRPLTVFSARLPRALPRKDEPPPLPKPKQTGSTTSPRINPSRPAPPFDLLFSGQVASKTIGSGIYPLPFCHSISTPAWRLRHAARPSGLSPCPGRRSSKTNTVYLVRSRSGHWPIGKQHRGFFIETDAFSALA